MNVSSCEDIQAWLFGAAGTSTPQLPPVSLRAHLRDCASCRGALVSLIAKMQGLPRESSHADCLADLPLFIELEQEDASAAAVAYPHVWWHLLVCAECAEDYDLTLVLVQAQRRGALTVPHPYPSAAAPSVGVAVSRPQHRQRLTLARQLLRDVLGSPAPLGAYRGDLSDGRTVLIDEQPLAEQLLSLVVYAPTADHYAVEVTITPPPTGSIVLTLGLQSYRAPFSAQGKATIRQIPADLLAESDGPDLVIAIEQAAL